jgi:hypothetical protein
MFIKQKKLMSKCRACGNENMLDGSHRAGTQLMKNLPKDMSEIDQQKKDPKEESKGEAAKEESGEEGEKKEKKKEKLVANLKKLVLVKTRKKSVQKLQNLVVNLKKLKDNLLQLLQLQQHTKKIILKMKKSLLKFKGLFL